MNFTRRLLLGLIPSALAAKSGLAATAAPVKPRRLVLPETGVFIDAKLSGPITVSVVENGEIVGREVLNQPPASEGVRLLHYVPVPPITPARRFVIESQHAFKLYGYRVIG